MNPYIRRLNSFSPVTIAQAPIPGRAVGNMDGIPLEALQGTSSPEQLKQEGMYGGNMSPGGGMMPPGFGGPITGRPQPKYVTDLPIKVNYRNIYGTNIGGEYNLETGDISGQVVVPIGQAEKGYRLGIEGNYNPGRMDPYGMKQPAGFGGMIRFSKSNPVNPNTYEAPGAEKYSIQVGVDGKPRRVPPQMTVPVQIQPDPQMFQGLLNGR
tara:strand:- start:44 stop:673 length:630 start_codon:yes stop_codon:yes gene_type:complete